MKHVADVLAYRYPYSEQSNMTSEVFIYFKELSHYSYNLAFLHCHDNQGYTQND